MPPVTKRSGRVGRPVKTGGKAAFTSAGSLNPADQGGQRGAPVPVEYFDPDLEQPVDAHENGRCRGSAGAPDLKGAHRANALIIGFAPVGSLTNDASPESPALQLQLDTCRRQAACCPESGIEFGGKATRNLPQPTLRSTQNRLPSSLWNVGVVLMVAP